MTTRWGRNVTAALRELGPEWGYELLEPSKILYRVASDSVVTYQPDCVWTWVRRGSQRPNYVVWEAEHHWPNESYPTWKGLAGDIALASLLGSPKAEVYPYRHTAGHEIRKSVRIVDAADNRRAKLIGPGQRQYLGPAASVSFLMAVPSGDSRIIAKVRHYLEVLTRYGPCKFAYSDVVPCNGRSKSTAKRSIARSETVRQIHNI